MEKYKNLKDIEIDITGSGMSGQNIEAEKAKIHLTYEAAAGIPMGDVMVFFECTWTGELPKYWTLKEPSSYRKGPYYKPEHFVNGLTGMSSKIKATA